MPAVPHVGVFYKHLFVGDDKRQFDRPTPD
jgi:hypothetical protein